MYEYWVSQVWRRSDPVVCGAERGRRAWRGRALPAWQRAALWATALVGTAVVGLYIL